MLAIGQSELCKKNKDGTVTPKDCPVDKSTVRL